jgi:uncharacterized protein YebE (UPF0316 family)
MTTLKILAYFVAGFCQWSLATLRTWYIAKDKPKMVAVVVFVEEIVTVFVVAYVILNPKQWWLLLSGAFGGAIGSYVCLRIKGENK